MQSVVSAILEYNAGRDPQRLTLKLAALRRDAHSFLRGTCHRYVDCLPVHPLLQDTPLAWSCGDLHLENFGSYEGDNGHVCFDINDFDEAVLAPLMHDPLRLLTHLLVLADDFGLSRDDAEEMATHFITQYADTLISGEVGFVGRDTAKGLVGDLLDDVGGRTHVDLLDSRTDLKADTRRIRLDGEKALPASKEQRAEVSGLLQKFAEAFTATKADEQFYEPLDIARRISGNGSLGLARYIILARGTGAPDGNALLDLKAVAPSVLAPALSNQQPAWKDEAERVATLQARMQAIPVAFLHAIRADKHGTDTSFVLRALQPSQDRVDLDRCKDKPRRLERLLETMAQVLAWAHLRGAGQQGAAKVDELIAFAKETEWRDELLVLAGRCSAQVEKDWKDYADAFDDGRVTA